MAKVLFDVVSRNGSLVQVIYYVIWNLCLSHHSCFNYVDGDLIRYPTMSRLQSRIV